ncbi:ATP-binding protein [Microbacterium suwonense]
MPENFIRAVRESGYLSVSSALAELVDNSLQAGATLVDIQVDRDADRNLPRISIEDNGGGMDTAELAACLRFGGSSRFDARDSFGRFGMGLPPRPSARRDESRSPHGGRDLPRSP